MNDSFRSNVFVQYRPETIGSACIYLAARQLQIPLPNNPPWFSIFNVDEDEIQEICLAILKLYARPKPNYDELEKTVNEAKKIQIEAKLKAKGLSSEQGTPNSRPCTPRNASPNPSVVSLTRKIKSEHDIHGNGTPVEKNHVKKRSRSPEIRRGSSKSHSSGSSRSRSHSPPRQKSRKYRTPPKKHKKDRLSPERYREKHHSHKHEKRRKRSLSRSRSQSFSPSPEHRHGHKKYYKAKERYRSPEPHRRSHKHRNGHSSPIRDKYSKYYHR